MAVMQIETRKLRGVTVVNGGKTGGTGNGRHPAVERQPAPTLSVLRRMSRLSPLAGLMPRRRQPSVDHDADGDAARRAGRSRSCVLGYRGSASSAGRTVPLGWSPRAGETWPEATAYRGCLDIYGRVLSNRRTAKASATRPQMSPAPFGPTTGAFTASWRGKRAG